MLGLVGGIPMSEGSRSDKFRDRATQEARQADTSSVDHRFGKLAKQSLDPRLIAKVGTIRKIRRWLTRDLTSLAVGMSASVLLGGPYFAATLREGSPLPSGLAGYAIAVWGVIASGLITGFFLILACYLVEHVTFLRRWRFAYGVALLMWAAFCMLLWNERTTELREKGREPPGIAEFWELGFAALSGAAFAACIPLLVIGAITSLFMRRTKGRPSDSLLTAEAADCAKTLINDRRTNDEALTNRPGPSGNVG
jgi:hypothetical protein